MIYVLLLINFIIFAIIGTFINEWLGIIIFLILTAILFVLSIAMCANVKDTQNDIQPEYTTFEEILREIKEPIDLSTDDMIEFSIIRHFMD